MKIILLVFCLTAFCCSDSGKSKSVTINGIQSKTIPGLTAVDVHGNLTNKGFTLSKKLDSEPSSWTCFTISDLQEYQVTAIGKGPSDIITVDAIVTTIRDSLNKDAIEFMGYIASLPYKGSSPHQAKDWAISHSETGGETTIGEVTFKIITNSKKAKVLKLWVE